VTPPPVSTRIAADVGGYGSGLVLFRMGDHNAWVRWFAEAVSGAGRAQQELVASVERLQREWRERLGGPRAESRRVRSDAAAWRVLDLLPRHLVLTGPIVASELAVPLKSANAALGELVDAGILVEHGTVQPSGRGRPSRLYTSASCSVSPGRTRCAREAPPIARSALGGVSFVIRGSRRGFFRYPVSQRFFFRVGGTTRGILSPIRAVVDAARYRLAMR